MCCQYFSCIVTRKLDVLWLKTSNSHEDIIRKFQIDDSKLENRDFVRIEIRPDNSSRLTRDKKDWTFHVDEEDTLPDWFFKARSQAEAKCWSAWKESVACQIVLGEEERTFEDGEIVYAYDSAKVFASGYANVEAYDNVTVEAYDNVTVEAYDNVTVEAYDNVTVRANDNATVEANNSANVRAFSNANIIAYCNANIIAYCNVTVRANDNANIQAYNNATVEAYDNATVRTYDNATVQASGNVTVRAYSSANKVQVLSSTATVIYRGKVYVRQDAQVQVVEGEFLAANYTSP